MVESLCNPVFVSSREVFSWPSLLVLTSEKCDSTLESTSLTLAYVLYSLEEVQPLKKITPGYHF